MGERMTEADLAATDAALDEFEKRSDASDGERAMGRLLRQSVTELRRLRGLLLFLGSVTRRHSIAELAQLHGVDHATALASVEAEIAAIRQETPAAGGLTAGGEVLPSRLNLVEGGAPPFGR